MPEYPGPFPAEMKEPLATGKDQFAPAAPPAPASPGQTPRQRAGTATRCTRPLSLLREHWLRASLWLFLLLHGASAQANDLGEIARRWTDNLKGLGPLLVIVFAVIGLICMGVGLYKFTTTKRHSNQIAEGVVYIVVGSLLLSITAFSGLLSGTSFGSNEATTSLNALGIN